MIIMIIFRLFFGRLLLCICVVLLVVDEICCVVCGKGVFDVVVVFVFFVVGIIVKVVVCW